MTSQEFVQQLNACIAQYDLLCHPFYKAWSAGELTRGDLREYALDYFHHVKAFPTYLAEFSLRLEDGELRRSVLANMRDELGGSPGAVQGATSHAELWLDFAEGMGARRSMVGHQAPPEVGELMEFFYRMAGEGVPEEVLAAFYAYESQVPRVAREKARGLREMYGADEKTCSYFTLHTTADVYHSKLWRQQLEKLLSSNPDATQKALNAAEKTAQALWRVLDGIDARRREKAAA